MRSDDQEIPFTGMCILELSYRLTVIVNMSEYNLESSSWMESWNTAISACARKWYSHLELVVDRKSNDIVYLQSSAQIIKGLPDKYTKFSDDPSAPSHDLIVYSSLLEQTAMTSHHEFFDCFMLGMQLAQRDLCAYYSSIGKPGLHVFLPRFVSFTLFSENSFPLSWVGWPGDTVFNDTLNRYVTNRQHLSGANSFSISPLLYLVQSIACPPSVSSTAWCWEDWDGSKPWHLLLAGSLFPKPMLVTVKDQNDKAFVILFEVMDRDKKAGNPTDACGRILRKELWLGKSSVSCRKAWEKLTKKTLVALGNFMFDGEKGKNRDTGGYCRLPSVFAESDCQIFVERLKKTISPVC